MATYMLQVAYTAEAWAAQVKHPGNRVETGARPAVEAAGGKLIGGWLCFGDYDMVVIAEMPSEESMAGLAMAVAAGGALKASKTTLLMSGEQGLKALKAAGEVAKLYKPPR